MKVSKVLLTGLLGAGVLNASPMFSFLADHETVDPQILTEVRYEDYAYEYVNYEQAATSLNGGISCLNEEKATALADSAKATIEKIFAEVGPSGQLANLKVTLGELSFEDPIQDNYRVEVSDEKVQYVFWNKCEEKEVKFHENLEKVASVSLKVEITADLTAEDTIKLDKAVDAIEAYADKTPNLEIKCNINTSPAYTPQLSDAKRKEVSDALREKAVELAQAQADAEEVNYESLFSLPLRSTEDDKLEDALPTGFKKLDNGRYQVTRTKRVDYNVRYYAEDEKSATEKLVTGTVSFPVQVSATGTEGIFGELMVNYSQDCFASKEEAQKAFTGLADPSEIRGLKGNAEDPESDNLEKGKLSVVRNNLVRTIKRYVEGSDNTVNNYYSACEPEKILNAPLTEETQYYSASVQHVLRLSEIQKLESYAEGKSSSKSLALGNLVQNVRVSPRLRLDAQRILDLENTKAAKVDADAQAKAFKGEKELSVAYLVQGYPRAEFAGGFGSAAPQANKAVYLDQPISGLPAFADEEGKALIQVFHTIIKKAVWSL